VLYGVYRDFAQLATEDPRCRIANPMFSHLDQPGIGTVLAPRSPLTFPQTPSASPAPALGQHTEQVATSTSPSQPTRITARRARSDPPVIQSA
jgi:2-methylfumaryl-CoA isomerase